MLPIAIDQGLQFICVDASKQGSPVFLVAIDRMYNTTPPSIKEVFSSFRDFSASLRQPPSAKCPVEAFAKERWEKMRSILDISKLDLLVSKNGLTLLSEAVRNGNDDLVLGLLSVGVNLTGALEVAVANKRIDLVKLLVDSGANAADGVAGAVGFDRREIRDFLKSKLSKGS